MALSSARIVRFAYEPWLLPSASCKVTGIEVAIVNLGQLYFMTHPSDVPIKGFFFLRSLLMQTIRVALFSLLLAALAVAQNQFVYTNNQSQPNTVTGFLVNSDGSLTQVAGSPFATGANGQNGADQSLAVTTLPDKNYLYAANGADGTISGFSIDPATGNLSQVPASPFTTNNQAANYSLAIGPDNRFLFVASDASPLIHVFTISPETGGLHQVSGSPFSFSNPFFALKVSANGQFLFAGNQREIAVFQIAQNGSLSVVPGSPFAANGFVQAEETNCAGNLVFVASGGIDVYSLGSDGSLTPVPGSPFPNGSTSGSVDLVLSPSNQFLFVSESNELSGSGAVSALDVSAHGRLALVKGSPFPVEDVNAGIAITSKGDFLYTVLFISGEVDGRRVGADGTLTPVPGTPFNTGGNSIAGLVESIVTFPAPSCPQR
jgi:6-phosphogluconolactonase